jgi:hypothetical protein
MAHSEVFVGATEQQRQAEIQAGRDRVHETMGRMHDTKHYSEIKKRADAQIKEDEERRHQLLTAPGLGDRARLDRAGAEVADQAQTELEAVTHFADRRHRIILGEHSNAVERLEHEDADPKLATQTTLNEVTAQAVNQPTPLANEQGRDTIDRPLNNTLFLDHELELDRPGITPEDRHVPKTREQAEEVARVRVPDAEQVVRPGWHQDQNTTEPVAVATTDPAVIEGNRQIAEQNVENRTVALDAVEDWPDELKADQLVEDAEKPKRGWPKGKPRK